MFVEHPIMVEIISAKQSKMVVDHQIILKYPE